MSAPVHQAVVQEVLDDEGDRAFRATCLETGAECDAWGFPDLLDAPAFEVPPDERDGAAIERALRYLGDRNLHDFDSPHFCDARHVLP
jgi:hypothetical protein